MTPKPCILIAGPTAGGKSALAVAVAKAVGGVVINADSMQVYHPLLILTARPTSTDEAGVAHRLYGVVSGETRFSVGRWLARATAEIDAARGQGLVPVLVGGTGLYFKALLGGLAEIPDIPGDVRAHWADVSQAGGPAQLARELARLDPAMAARLEPGDRQRMVRALEVMSATGRSLADWQNDTAPPALATAQTVRIVLSPARADIHARIARRVDA
ncbi:MAG: tRNA (adenosine(37)-N6)-dimethylallyltransferase MiaA, partial [Hyphomicrobiales bacterium]